ncbi:MAG: hypothetical protein CL473_02475 [Acidobacteria bacterium]|nr:hypothetical protein [Acidobacteriota bacterium]
MNVGEHTFFQREGDDLLCKVPVSFPTLALGGEIEVPTLTDSSAFQIPKGTQPDTRFRLRGKGMPRVDGRGHGDLYVAINLAVPTKLTPEQEQLLEELGRTLPDPLATGTDEERPFFERVKDIFG